jgi:hypothetical protein
MLQTTWRATFNCPCRVGHDLARAVGFEDAVEVALAAQLWWCRILGGYQRRHIEAALDELESKVSNQFITCWLQALNQA